MTEKNEIEKEIAIGEPDETGARPIIATVGALVPLSREEIEGYICLKNLRDTNEIEAVILYDARKNLIMTPLVIIYPQKGNSYLLDTTTNIPLTYGKENAVRVALSYLKLHDESIIKASKKYIKCQQALESSLESLKRSLR